MKFYLIIATIIVGLIAICAVTFFIRGPALIQQTAAAPGAALEGIIRALHLDPSVTIVNSTVRLGGEKVQQFVSYEVRFRKENSFAIAWMGSTKSVRLSGTWIAKLGYEINATSVIYESGKTIHMQVHGPLVISLECPDMDFASENGWWNKVTDEDRRDAIAKFRYFAERDAYEMNNKQRTQSAFKDMMEAVVGPLGYAVNVISDTL